MSKKILLVAALAAFVSPALIAPAAAQTALSSSDEEFLSEMPDITFPGKEEMQDRNNDGIVDSEQTHLSAEELAKNSETEKAKVKYVYDPEGETTLRRSIKDDRIDDGYVQGLMKQRGPR